MQLGFVTAVLPDLSFEEVLQFAADTGYDCVEVMCWPHGKATRRYAGVTHIDVSNFTKEKAKEINSLRNKYGVGISALGYYPNPLSPEPEETSTSVEHLKKVIEAASILSVGVNSFIGRDWTKSVDDNCPGFLDTWKPLIRFAADRNVRIGIENCPMIFTKDEWPGGKNLMTTPAIWKRMFNDIPDEHFGLNFDPSHFIWQHMDYIKAIRDFGSRFHHVHAKDVRIDKEKLDKVGTMAYPLEYHTPKLPGMGDVNWGSFFSALTDAGYDGPVCVEVEDRAFEGNLERRKLSLRQSHAYLRQFIQ